LIAGLLLTLFCCTSLQPARIIPCERERVVLLTTGSASQSFERPYSAALGAIGIHPEIVTVTDRGRLALPEIKVLIIPGATVHILKTAFIQQVVNEISRGLCVIIEEQSELACALGVQFLKRNFPVESLKDSLHPDIPISWSEQIQVKEIDPKGRNIFCCDRISGIPVISGGSLGQGRFLYLGVPLDKSDGWGYSRFPFFHEAVVGFFHLKPYLKRNRLMVYLDWGFHYSENPESLARRLKGYGISEVHLSSWYDVRQCRDFFKQFITACHEKGILVYSWLELPMVTREFWNAHPEWREKTATGEDARVDWRLLMALEIPGCMEAVKTEIKKGIDAFDWDGVDVAELYFESPLGVEEPENFTPLSNVVRDDFKSRYGVDPMELFNPQSTHFHKNERETLDRFFQYRSELCTRLNREVLLFVKEMRQRNTGRPVDVMLTQVDSIVDTTMRDNIAVDPDAFMQLQQELGFTLQVEDPFTLWSRGPDRYRVIGTAYRSRMAEGARLTVDVNIVNRVDTRYPTSKQTGLEFLVLLSEASSHADQVCLYAAHTPNEFDYTYAPYALAGQAHLKKNDRNQYSVRSPYTVLFETETDGKEFLVNGKPWPCVNKMGVILPSGNSVVTETSPSAEAKSRLFITDLTAEIGACSWSGKSIILRYNDKRNVLVSLNRKSGRVSVNGREEHLPRFSGDGIVTFSCPAGENEVIFFDEEDR